MQHSRLVRPTLAAAGLLLALGCRPAEVPGTVYGEQPSLSDTTLISTVLADPESFVGERVLVAGTVVEVCEKRGCWLQLGGDEEYQTLRVKVEDGVIVFPLTARGHAAVVEGIVEKIVLTAEVGTDTDEFDQHVIAHEFGHYIEHNFSRADNIGGELA